MGKTAGHAVSLGTLALPVQPGTGAAAAGASALATVPVGAADMDSMTTKSASASVWSSASQSMLKQGGRAGMPRQGQAVLPLAAALGTGTKGPAASVEAPVLPAQQPAALN